MAELDSSPSFSSERILQSPRLATSGLPADSSGRIGKLYAEKAPEMLLGMGISSYVENGRCFMVLGDALAFSCRPLFLGRTFIFNTFDCVFEALTFYLHCIQIYKFKLWFIVGSMGNNQLFMAMKSMRC